MKTTFIVILLIIAIGFGSLYAISPIRPKSWQPDANAGLQNMFMENDELNTAMVLHASTLIAPEDIVVTSEGLLYTGLENGDVVSFDVNEPDNIRVIANTGGRPLGVRLNKSGNIVVSDPVKGLLSITPEGEISTLVTQYKGKSLLLIDHHDIAENGDIYFSDASARYSIDNFIYDFLETSATGSIYKYSAQSGDVEKVMDGLFFANGVALGPNDEYLLVAETGKSRILKHHLVGDTAGTTSVFASHLPGMPDNISYNDKGEFWIGMVSLRDWRVEGLAAFPALRRALGALPIEWFEPTEHYGFFLGYDTYGNVIANYQGDSKYTAVTSVYEHEGKLYLGSLHSNGIAVIKR
ncbi:SMP-30/gluconolactonase/LRE family protein [Ningiella sp. W23]|uniref:SMP-30/gluconolactonase/LRE family protein n=1 Tax=Ningiella sp. W23 TaxID=3023715 RepID=UPI0037574BED